MFVLQNNFSFNIQMSFLKYELIFFVALFFFKKKLFISMSIPNPELK